MNQQPKISIIIPIYNSEKYLHKCLDSVVNQTFKDIEIICVDDGSPDNSGMICDDYSQKDSRIKVIHQTNSGIGSARNRGLEIARGKYIQFLDADDSYQPNCCKEMYNIMEKYTVDVGIYNTNIIYEYFSHLKDNDEKYFSPKFKEFNNLTPDMINKIDVNCWNKIFRKSFLDKNNIKFPEKLHYEDVAFYWFWATKAKTIYCYNKSLINYVRRKDSFVGNLFRKESKYTTHGIIINNLIYDYLKQNNLLETFGEEYLRWIINRFSWQSSCISDTNYKEKQTLANAFSEIVSKFNVEKYNLNKNELIKYNIIKEKNELTPVFKDNYVTVVFNSDNNFVKYLAVTLQSIINNASKEHNYDIVILYSDISTYNKEVLLHMVDKKPNFSLRFFNMDKYATLYNINEFKTLNHVKTAAYYRLFIPMIFSTYDKITYLDADIAVNGDIFELNNTDITNYAAAAVSDFYISDITPYNEKILVGLCDYGKKVLNITDWKSYFNSGVMIFNITKILKKEYFAKFIEIAKINNRFFNDQNVLNSVLQGDVYLLDKKWNMQDYSKHEQSYVSDIKIIHYCGSTKPWNSPQHPMADLWWHYARQTPFYEEIIYKNLSNTSSNLPKDLLCNILQYRKNRLKYFRCRLLANLTFGKTRAHYKRKKKELKVKLKSVKQFLKG